MTKKIAITMGDPTGIGAEIILKALNDSELNQCELEKLTVIGNDKSFKKASQTTGLKLPSEVEFINIEGEFPAETDSKESGEIAYQTLIKAIDGVKDGKYSAIATAPLSKKAINLAGHNFSGHTEILDKFLKNSKEGETSQAEMLFANGKFKMLLLTRHIPLSEVSKNIKKENIIKSIKILNNALINDFKITSPKIAVCALNPHAGENGLLGKEEIEEITPAIDELKKQNINCLGAFPSDALFKEFPKSTEDLPYDAYVACYHDQGLIPMKMLSVENCTNITIGLQALRTSPTHGTAFDIAFQNKANHKSMLTAIKVALQTV